MTSQHVHGLGPREYGEGEEHLGGQSVEELLGGAHPRLLSVDSVTPELAGVLTYARMVTDGLVFVYALDLPDAVRVLTDPDVQRVDPQTLGAAAYRNLMAVPAEHEEVAVESGAVLHSVHGDSHFVASKVLYLPETVRDLTGDPLPDEGALVAMPSRHHFVYHPLADGSVVDALNSLAAYALGAYEDSGEAALSPRVHWWHRGRMVSLSRIDHDARTFSLDPPEHLLAVMTGLLRLDRSGRLATRASARAMPPSSAELARTTTQLIADLGQDEARPGEAFGAAMALALTQCAADPHAALPETWNAWATSVRLGSAWFTGAQAQECHLGEDLVAPLPALPAEPPADARAWLDALYLALVCRQWERIGRLCHVPLDRLREDDSVDEYVLHWVDTLQSFFSGRPMDDTVGRLLDTMRAAAPDAVTHAPMDYVHRIDYAPVALFHAVIAADHDAFTRTLAEAVEQHAAHWGDSRAPRAVVALGPLAMASLAHDYDFPLAPGLPYLPTYLLNRERVEDIL
ncbi:immunity 49 family protein [Streptomyces sp. NPDC006711]|uniref:immunity 49 family protein n=1 Tax=Streptomyces sp. NPDC006711 TaxID=3364762 RepID=UPI0036A2CCEB